jgi:hypothetical protein
MTTRRQVRAERSPRTPRPLVDEPLPSRLQHWRNVVPEIELTDDDHELIGQHLRLNPDDQRAAAEFLMRAARARRIQRDELYDWCEARGLIDDRGLIAWSRIRR